VILPGEGNMKPDVKGFFDEATNTISYVVAGRDNAVCAIVDPVLDYDAASGRTSTASADALIDYVENQRLNIEWILETHVHADHLTAAPYIRERLGGMMCISDGIVSVQEAFTGIFNLQDLHTDGRQFDRLLSDGDSLEFGNLNVQVLQTPGHTPACITYLIGDAAFVGDTLFMPDFGTARTDFPGGDAGQLYDSIQRIFALPPETRLFMCHDYKAPGRNEFAWETSVAEEKAGNINVHDGVSRADFVEFREKRDAQLGMPKLVLPAIQVNMRAGYFPPTEDNGVSYLKIPLNNI
jgi:glyoxylase-like metal-dependent hydrolase (beta-lactamase superfamily II)